MTQVKGAEDTIECPECHQEIVRAAAKKHALRHWPQRISELPEYVKARNRREQLVAFGDNREPRLEAE